MISIQILQHENTTIEALSCPDLSPEGFDPKSKVNDHDLRWGYHFALGFLNYYRFQRCESGQ